MAEKLIDVIAKMAPESVEVISKLLAVNKKPSSTDMAILMIAMTYQQNIELKAMLRNLCTEVQNTHSDVIRYGNRP